MNLVIDVGNTRIKTAVFKADTLVEHFVFSAESFDEGLQQILSQYPIQFGIIAKVTHLKDDSLLKSKLPFTLLELTAETPVSFINTYATPKTLGIDRIALAAGAATKYPGSNVLVIDAGTCITYDFVSAENTYLGGAISPGIQMRYIALHQQTSKLPLLELKAPEEHVGKSTAEAIHSGIIHGVLHEIEGVINHYSAQYQDLTIVLTGGDTNFLAKRLKSSIFANQNFLLKGLNSILIFNTKE